MNKELIEDIRQSLIPFAKKELLEINYEGLGELDAEEFEKDFNEVLDLAIKALEQPTMDKAMIHTLIKENDSLKSEIGRLRQALERQPCEDCVSRAEVLKQMKEWRDYEFVKMTNPYHYLEKRIQSMPPVKPTHGTCKDCRWLTTDEDGNYYCKQTWDFDSLDFYCADFEKRGGENDI